MKKQYKILWISIAIVASVLFILQQISPFSGQIENFEKIVGGFFTEKLSENIITPEPLRGPLFQQQSTLTRSGIVTGTNIQRAKEGLPALSESQKLSASAALKAQDIIDNQYFEHTSPDGVGIGDLAEIVDYEYVLIGENLALGNFKDDTALVTAWMDSLGHRKNILNRSYTQIGIGLSRGEFEGSEVWVAVQHFGKPRSNCPELDEDLLVEVDKNKIQIQELETKIEQKRGAIDSAETKRGPLYNAKVRDYNNLVIKYNNLVQETKLLVEQYNVQVQDFNQCAEE